MFSNYLNPMTWTNFHSHNHFCDGKSPIEDHVKKAIQIGLPLLGISSHAPVPFDNTWSMKYERFPDYCCEIDNLKQKYSGFIRIYKALEIDYIPGQAGPSSRFIREAELDYTIGSIHFVGKYEDGRNWPIDGPQLDFGDGLQKIYHNDIKAVVKTYYGLTRKMITDDPPDIVGHMDKIKMHSQHGKYFAGDEKWYRKEVLETLDCISSANIIMEVNTRGLYKKKSRETYPALWVIREAFQRKIPIMLNSDSHTPDELTGEFRETTLLLLESGYRTQRILTDHGWEDIPFNEEGLLI